MPRRAALLPPVAGSLLCCRSVARRAPCARVVSQSPSAFCEAFLCPRPIGQHLSGYSGEKSGPEQTPNLRSSCHLHPLLSVGSAIFYYYYRLLTTYHHYHFWGPHSHQLHQRANSTAIETTYILNTVPRRFSFEKN